MDHGVGELDEKVDTLLTRGDRVLDALRSVAKDAHQSHEALLRDAPPLFDAVDTVVEKLGIGSVVRPALDHLAAGWVDVLEREVRFFDLVGELETIHEELFAIVTKDGSR